jgi:hypothetical protein
MGADWRPYAQLGRRSEIGARLSGVRREVAGLIEQRLELWIVPGRISSRGRDDG